MYICIWLTFFQNRDPPVLIKNEFTFTKHEIAQFPFKQHLSYYRAWSPNHPDRKAVTDFFPHPQPYNSYCKTNSWIKLFQGLYKADIPRQKLINYNHVIILSTEKGRGQFCRDYCCQLTALRVVIVHSGKPHETYVLCTFREVDRWFIH